MVLQSGEQPRLFVDQDMACGELYAFAGGAAVVFSARCPGKDTANEDVAALIPFDAQAGVLAVADGLGGVPAGQHAAALAVKTLQASVDAAAREGLMLRTAILNGFEAANREVQALGIGTATTLAVIEIQQSTIRPYHAGDSMILVVGQRGKIRLQTTSHSPVGFAVEAGLLDHREALYHEDRHLVSNVIGSADMKIEIGPSLKLKARDTVLLASDGLFDNLHVEEIIQRVRKGPLEQVARQLAADSIQRMRRPQDDQPSKPDDLTLIAFRPQGSPA